MLVERHSVNMKTIIDDHNAINEYIYQNKVSGVLSNSIAPHGPYVCKELLLIIFLKKILDTTNKLKSNRYMNVGIAESEIGNIEKLQQNTPYKITSKATYKTPNKSPQQHSAHSARSFEKKKEKKDDFILSSRQDFTTRDNTMRKSSHREFMDHLDHSNAESSFVINNIVDNSPSIDIKPEKLQKQMDQIKEDKQTKQEKPENEDEHYISREFEIIEANLRNKVREPEVHKTAHFDVSISEIITKKDHPINEIIAKRDQPINEVNVQTFGWKGQPEQDQVIKVEKGEDSPAFQNVLIQKGMQSEVNKG